MRSKMLAAVRFDYNQDIDRLLAEFAAMQIERGTSVRGVLQSRGELTAECRCRDMDLNVIGAAHSFRISQSLGKGSRGCRLHAGNLAECSAFLDHQLKRGCDLLVLNRFGKGESEGHGFRDLINKAISMEGPVLLAVRATYISDWYSYVGDCAEILSPDIQCLEVWFEGLKNEVGGRTGSSEHRPALPVPARQYVEVNDLL